jgi:hypothetical protein
MQDNERINMDDAADVKRWTQRFGIDDQQLRSAVNAMGGDPREVANFLGQPMDQHTHQLTEGREPVDPERVDRLAGSPRSGGAGPAGGGEN